MGKNKKSQATMQDMVCKKNDILTMEIIDLSTKGEGVGRVDGYTLFVKDAVIGDVVRVLVMKTKKHFGYAKLLEIVTPSKDRIEPKCPVARQCGGCQLQHYSYESQIRWKENKVYHCLSRIGGFSEVPMEPILYMDSPYYYRNKAQFPVGTGKEGQIITGFYAGRTHSIVENTNCVIQHPCNEKISKAVLEFMEEYHISAYDEKEHTGLVRHILTRVGVKTGEVMVCLVINGTKLPFTDALVEKLLGLPLQGMEAKKGNVAENESDAANGNGAKNEQATVSALKIESICLNENTDKTNVILGQNISVLYGRDYIEDYIGNIKYQISPLSFFQVNPKQTERLYETALEYADLKGGEVVWDLYCGIGTISLFLAQKAAKVCGVEIVPQAIEDARKNAALNHFDNTEFFVGAAEEVVPEQYEKSNGTLKADVVTIDPPRKGCDERLLETVVQMQPSKIVYVSCDPATLARDARYLCDRGYELKRVRACDMFGQSYHVESVVLLTKKG